MLKLNWKDPRSQSWTGKVIKPTPVNATAASPEVLIRQTSIKSMCESLGVSYGVM